MEEDGTVQDGEDMVMEDITPDGEDMDGEEDGVGETNHDHSFIMDQ
jgi:hypothetical protein